jgi:hypothetical protein
MNGSEEEKGNVLRHVTGSGSAWSNTWSMHGQQWSDEELRMPLSGFSAVLCLVVVLFCLSLAITTALLVTRSPRLSHFTTKVVVFLTSSGLKAMHHVEIFFITFIVKCSSSLLVV